MFLVQFSELSLALVFFFFQNDFVHYFQIFICDLDGLHLRSMHNIIYGWVRLNAEFRPYI